MHRVHQSLSYRMLGNTVTQISLDCANVRTADAGASFKDFSFRTPLCPDGVGSFSP